MDVRSFVPDWRAVITYAAPGPQPTLVVDQPDFRVLVAGLAPDGAITPHPGPLGVYHALEGEGIFHLDDEALAFHAGAIVVAPAGSTRGITAVTRLAFMAVRVGSEPGA